MSEASFWMGDESKNVPISIPPNHLKKADISTRLIAYLIDAVIVTIGAIFCILPGLAYFIIRDALWDGRSVGKKVMGLQVINKDTRTPCKTMESVMRNISLMIPIFGIIDGLMVFIDPEGFRFGDKWANTIVIENKTE